MIHSSMSLETKIFTSAESARVQQPPRLLAQVFQVAAVDAHRHERRAAFFLSFSEYGNRVGYAGLQRVEGVHQEHAPVRDTAPRTFRRTPAPMSKLITQLWAMVPLTGMPYIFARQGIRGGRGARRCTRPGTPRARRRSPWALPQAELHAPAFPPAESRRGRSWWR